MTMWLNDVLVSLSHPSVKVPQLSNANQTLNARWLICLLCNWSHLSCSVCYEAKELIC